MSAEDKLPTLEAACLTIPLYKVIARGDEAVRFARIVEETNLKFDTFCVECGKEATFSRFVQRKPPVSLADVRHSIPKPSLIQAVACTCTRAGHAYRFYFAPYRDAIAKVGQTPSMADIADHDLRRFREVLDQADLAELQQATRLQSHGAGIAAYVYLRRIFERLIQRHHDAYVADHGAIEGYEGMPMDRRVLALSSVLPAEVVENRKIYDILSKGIHELDEDTCLLYYAFLRAAIVEILDRDLYLRQNAKNSRDLRNAIADIAGKLG